MDEATGLLEVTQSSAAATTPNQTCSTASTTVPCLPAPSIITPCTQSHTTTTSAVLHHNLILSPQATYVPLHRIFLWLWSLTVPHHTDAP